MKRRIVPIDSIMTVERRTDLRIIRKSFWGVWRKVD
jgi:hypothetical protein